MSNFSSEALKAGIIPANLTNDEEVRKFIDSLDPDIMGFDGNESPDDLMDYIDDKNISTAIAGVSIGEGINIIDNLTTKNYSNIQNKKKFLVIHFTAGSTDNGTAAKANSNYFKSVYRGASAHYFVDKSSNIYRCVPDNLVAWHCGTSGKYYHSSCRNSNAIGIELCSYASNGKYYFYDQTVKNALVLARYIVKKYNIPKNNVLMHWHVTHKVCAAPFITNSKPNSLWDNFKNKIFSNESLYKVTKMNSTGKVINITSNDVLNVRSGPGTSFNIINRLKNNTIVNITGKFEDWYRLDNNGFVLNKYIQIIHWCDNIRDALLSKKIITDKNQWSRYSDIMSKGLVVKVLSNIYGNEPNVDNSHWASNAVHNLVKHGIISDNSQWKDLDSNISRALLLSLIDKATGGTLPNYKNRKPDHWGRNNLDSLCDKVIITDPKYWTNFDSTVTKDYFMALIYKALNKIL